MGWRVEREGEHMSEWMFRWFMEGRTIDEIIEHCPLPKPTEESVRETLLSDRRKFEDDCLKKVISNAKEGNVEAIDWLSKRGLFDSIKLK